MDISATPILGESYSKTPSSSMWLHNPVTSSMTGKLTLADMTPSNIKHDDFDVINDDKDDITQETTKQSSPSSKGLLNLSFQAKLMKESTNDNQEALNDNNSTKSNTNTNTNTSTKSNTYRSLKSDFERARKLLQSRGAL